MAGIINLRSNIMSAYEARMMSSSYFNWLFQPFTSLSLPFSVTRRERTEYTETTDEVNERNCDRDNG